MRSPVCKAAGQEAITNSGLRLDVEKLFEGPGAYFKNTTSWSCGKIHGRKVQETHGRSDGQQLIFSAINFKCPGIRRERRMSMDCYAIYMRKLESKRLTYLDLSHKVLLTK